MRVLSGLRRSGCGAGAVGSRKRASRVSGERAAKPRGGEERSGGDGGAGAVDAAGGGRPELDLAVAAGEIARQAEVDLGVQLGKMLEKWPAIAAAPLPRWATRPGRLRSCRPAAQAAEAASLMAEADDCAPPRRCRHVSGGSEIRQRSGDYQGGAEDDESKRKGREGTGSTFALMADILSCHSLTAVKPAVSVRGATV